MAGFRIGGKRGAAKARDKLAKVEGPSPNPMTNMLISDIAMRGGGALMRHLAERAVLGAKYDPKTAKGVVAGRSMKQTLIGTALARLATRSVPGALVVGGGLLAKTLYDHGKGKRAARAEGEEKIARQARRG
jgi:hypothetical protein